jgi:hypothetical protein
MEKRSSDEIFLKETRSTFDIKFERPMGDNDVAW